MSAEDSIYVDDSDDQSCNDEIPRLNVNSRRTTPMDTRVIGESESEDGEESHLVLKDSSPNRRSSDSGTVNSEEEDMEFFNASHKVSIEISSDSDSSPEIKPRKNPNLKRRSIYDNPESPFTPGNKRTPVNRKSKKRLRRIVTISDSEAENISVNQSSVSYKKSDSELISEDSDKEMNEVNGKDVTGKSMNYTEESDDQEMVELNNKSTRDHTDHKINRDSSDDENSHHNSSESSGDKENTPIPNTMSTRKNVSAKKKSLNFQNLSRRSRVYQKKASEQLNFTDLLDDSSDSSTNLNVRSRATSSIGSIEETKRRLFEDNNPVDLTNDEIKLPVKNENMNSAIIVLSTSTSESEMDKDAVAFAKQEIGTSNGDPILAQKKEMLMLKINSLQEKLDKLNKFTKSIDIQKLPDKGEKVYQEIKGLQSKLAPLKAELEKVERKSMSKIRNSSTPKIKSEPASSSNWSPRDSALDDKKNIKIKDENWKTSESDYHNKFEDFDVKDIPNVPKTNFNTKDLGKQALETLNKQQSLTNQRLELLHGSLTSRPSEDQRDKDPKGLNIPLMAHQQHALAWMKWRENQKPKGGILADDMGLGKTLTMISLVLANVDTDKERDSDSSSDDDWYPRKLHKRYYGGTLVVCPASLINQWESEVKKRVKRGLLSVLVFHGCNRQMDERKLSKYNIVITTYQTLVREAAKETSFYKMEWSRAILDEAHIIRNHKSQASIAACGVSARRRWALTGTPIQNKEADLYAILKFLQCSPFDDLQVWKRWVENKNDAGKQRLITLMKTLMLRRTKKELMAKGALESLPEKFFETIEIEMDRDENLVYQKILMFSQNLFAQFLAQRAEKHHMKELYGGKFDKKSPLGSVSHFTKAQKILLQHHSQQIESHEILVLLLRLRQMCCHPALIHKMLDRMDAELNGIEDAENLNEDILQQLQNMSIKEDENVDEDAANYKFDTKIATNLLTKNNPVFSNNRRSSKVRAVLKKIKEVLEKGDKLIVVSQWTEFLKVVAQNLVNCEDVKYKMFTGEVAIKDRQQIVDEFNSPRSGVNVLFLSLTAGGVGLNLVGANHVLLIDLHWNPQLESQAQDRVYRFGQKKNVFIYKFFCKDTIEERIRVLQERKLECAEYVLTGTKSTSAKLTLDDLKLLFS
ncbi:transcription termination factor 2-like [Copidosoma floridanum]|uniref:transcription termination factor 2-like n=1 Tax=Copidosoma floridanum TaxID=29053 RepID=UPI0006C96E4E|nr:transcription termination factor 2-like [Copidosoma floridanum]